MFLRTFISKISRHTTTAFKESQLSLKIFIYSHKYWNQKHPIPVFDVNRSTKMNLLVSLIVFILFWWALLATFFSYQLHKENEDYARRLGKRLETQKIAKQNNMDKIRNSILLPVKVNSLKFNLNSLSLDRIGRILPLKINFK